MLVGVSGYAVPTIIGAQHVVGTTTNILTVQGIADVPFGASEDDLLVGLRDVLRGLEPNLETNGDPIQTGEWFETDEFSECGITEVRSHRWGDLYAAVGRGSAQQSDPAVFFGYDYLHSGQPSLATTEGVTTGQSLDEVQQLAAYLEYFAEEYFDEEAPDGYALVSFVPYLSSTLQLANLSNGSVSSIRAGWRCFFGMQSLPDPLRVSRPAQQPRQRQPLHPRRQQPLDRQQRRHGPRPPPGRRSCRHGRWVSAQRISEATWLHRCHVIRFGSTTASRLLSVARHSVL